MAAGLVCWKCGHGFEDLPLPLSRLAECKKCHAPLHVCRLCEFYDTHVANQCREPVADVVKEKERANFCGYFKPRPHAYKPVDTAREQAGQAALEALFGLKTDKNSSGEPSSAAEQARTKLDELFRK